MKTINIKYSCPKCGILSREVPVTARTNEDVGYWFEEIMIVELCNDHAKHSPNCHPDMLHDIMIPVGEHTNQIGAAEPTKH